MIHFLETHFEEENAEKPLECLEEQEKEVVEVFNDEELFAGDYFLEALGLQENLLSKVECDLARSGKELAKRRKMNVKEELD